MKFLSLVGLFLLVGCGTPNQQNQASGGSSRFDPQPLTTDQMAGLSNLCHAIDVKTSRLDSDRRDFVFRYKADNCDSNADIKVHDVITNIDISRDSSGNDAYSFQPKTAENYPFKEIETTTTGVVSKMCANVRDTSATGGKDSISLDTSGSKVLWFSMASSSECQPDDLHQCLFLVYGYKNSTGEYDHSTRETLRIAFDELNMGYFTARVKRSFIGCKNGESILATELR